MTPGDQLLIILMALIPSCVAIGWYARKWFEEWGKHE